MNTAQSRPSITLKGNMMCDFSQLPSHPLCSTPAEVVTPFITQTVLTDAAERSESDSAAGSGRYLTAALRSDQSRARTGAIVSGRH